MREELRALNRFGLGARIGEPATLSDPRAWLEAQVWPGLAHLSPEGLPTSDEAAAAIRGVRESQRGGDPEGVRRARRALGELLARESRAVLGRRVTTESPFAERLVAFWSNHLCVSVAGKQAVIPLAGLYEREVVRPHVFGRFQEMVLASARHPAMLLYLDNFQSMGPESRAARAAGRRRGRTRGLNENYARELLELHTLGVDGGYSQQDVVELAKILTGWTLPAAGGREGGSQGFVFHSPMHEPGRKTVLGKVYRERGEAEGEEVIRMLCARPETARFVATKLTRHFVADDAPPAAVDGLARVFRDSDGDLAEVSRALIRLEEAWMPEHRKLRAPQDWLVAVLRAFHARDVAPAMAQLLRQLRHPLWAPQAPKGYGDGVRDWADPDSLMNRAELARTIATRLDRGSLAPERLIEVVESGPDDPLRDLLTDPSVPPGERIALGIGGPAFQWR